MAKIIKVNTVRLGNDADKVRKCISTMNKQMESMKAQIAQLDAMWDGPSSDAFKMAFHDDMKALSIVLKNLEKIHQYETTAKKKYDSCEKKVADIVAGIHV